MTDSATSSIHKKVFKSMLSDIVDHAFDGCDECSQLVSYTINRGHEGAFKKEVCNA